MKRARDGAFCCYCKRPLTHALPECSTSFTFDHVKCLSDGGWKRVPCCRKCNNLKGNLGMDEWFWFIRAHERWWKTFATPAQVASAVHAFKIASAYARKAAG
jgi:5-methylcytosine-specific restriction endonuclease McrA